MVVFVDWPFGGTTFLIGSFFVAVSFVFGVSWAFLCTGRGVPVEVCGDCGCCCCRDAVSDVTGVAARELEDIVVSLPAADWG